MNIPRNVYIILDTYKRNYKLVTWEELYYPDSSLFQSNIYLKKIVQYHCWTLPNSSVGGKIIFTILNGRTKIMHFQIIVI